MKKSRIICMTRLTVFMSLLIVDTTHSAQTKLSVLEKQTRHTVAEITVLQIERCLTDDINLNALQFPETFCKDNLSPYLILREEYLKRERQKLTKLPPCLDPVGRKEIFQKNCLKGLTTLALKLLYPPKPFDPRKHDPFVCDKVLDPYILESHPELRFMPLHKRNLFFARYVAELDPGIRTRLEKEYAEYKREKDALKQQKGIFFIYGFT